MKIHDFIFSNKAVLRISRHVLFWVIRFLFLFLWFFSVYYVSGGGVNNFNKVFLSPTNLMSFLVVDIAFCYTVVYWLLPGFLLKKKYYLFAFIFSGLLVLAFFIKLQYTLGLHIEMGQPAEERYIVVWTQTIYFINGGPPIICGLFMAIKMLKNWFIKEEEKVVIARANADAELQLLKAQVHPHFLFNTLNNIYSFTLSNTPTAAGLVLRLTDTLKYMTNDCAAELVPLEKELKMIRDYMGLEKVRYGKRLNMETEIKGDFESKLIAPLLLIPFVENCFKHGTSKMLEHPWIKMHITVLENDFEFELRNSKPFNVNPPNGKNGIGLANVKKRLGLLYPYKHSLKISEASNEFYIDLKLPLQKAEEQGVKIKEQVKIPGTLTKAPAPAM
jgi:hypothetical protein